MAAATGPSTAEAPAPAIDESTYEGDSAYDSELNSYTTSLASAVTDYKHENGRRYHAHKEGAYVYPNDEKEADRLDITHQMILTAMDGKLHAAPIKNPRRILDIGTGTGIWAIEMGDKYGRGCDILGNDLSAIQPRWVPPNVRFEVDDVEADWTYSSKFDFIHCRFMYTAISDWPRLFKQIYDGLEDGAYAEFTDVDLKWKSPDNTLAGSAGEKVNQIFIDSCQNILRKEPSPGKYLEKWATDAGFEDIHIKSYVMPFGTWPADKKLKEVGAWNHLQTMEGLESFFMAVFTRILNYRREEVDVLCAQVRQNLKDPKYHTYFTVNNVWCRKPGTKKLDDIDEAAAATKTRVPEATDTPAAAKDSTAETAKSSAPAAASSDTKDTTPATAPGGSKDSAPVASATAPKDTTAPASSSSALAPGESS